MGAKSKLGLAGLVLVGILTCVLGCKDNKNGHIIPPPVNNAPVIQPISDDIIYENQLYTKTINMSDADGDDLTPSLISYPTGASITKTGPNTAQVTWTPDDSHSNMDNPFTASVDDGNGGVANESWSVYPHNTEPVSGNVSHMFNKTGLEGAVVTVGVHSDTTDASGDFNIPDVEDGGHQVHITCSGHYDHGAGTLTSNKTKNLENIDFKIIPTTYNMNFFDEVCRSYDGDTFVGAGNGKTQRITDEDCVNWQCYINTNDAVGSSVPITPTMISYAQDVMEIDWPVLTNGKLNPTQANGRIQIGTSPPAYWTSLTTIYRWNDTLPLPGGVHDEALKNENEIDSNYAMTKTSALQQISKSELFQVLGARRDSDLESSIVNTPPQTDYTDTDYKTMTILYSRPVGNTTPDNNPPAWPINP